jgi:hypothetical protein
MFDLISMFFVGVEIYLANKLTAKVISDLIQFTRYMSAPMKLRHGTFRLRIYLSSSSGQKISFFVSSDRTIIDVLKG